MKIYLYPKQLTFMKTYKKLLLFILLFSGIVIYSCKKDSSNSQVTQPSSRPAYQKRWIVSSSTTLHRPVAPTAALKGSFLRPSVTSLARRPQGDSSFIAIEFLLNSYVVFYADDSVKVGQYTATNDTTLVLDSLGTVKITSITNNTFSFTLVPLDGSSSIAVIATPAPIIEPFTNPTDSAFMSNVWKIDSVYDIDSGKLDTTFFSEDSLSEVYALFSSYGTYLVRNVYTNGTEDYATNTWLWSSSAHEGFCYGMWDGANISDCSGLQSTTTFSPPYTNLIIQEEDSTDPYRYYLSKQ
jgi:hypothetical protein